MAFPTKEEREAALEKYKKDLAEANSAADLVKASIEYESVTAGRFTDLSVDMQQFKKGKVHG